MGEVHCVWNIIKDNECDKGDCYKPMSDIRKRPLKGNDSRYCIAEILDQAIEGNFNALKMQLDGQVSL